MKGLTHLTLGKATSLHGKAYSSGKLKEDKNKQNTTKPKEEKKERKILKRKERKERKKNIKKMKKKEKKETRLLGKQHSDPNLQANEPSQLPAKTGFKFDIQTLQLAEPVARAAG